MLYNALGRCLLGDVVRGVGPTQMLLDRGSTFFVVRIFFQKRLRGRPMAMQFNLRFNLHTDPGCFGGFCFSIYIFFIILDFNLFPNFPVVAFAIAGS